MTHTAERVLRDFDTIAVVGLSRDPAKAAHAVPAALQSAGFRIIPINPVVGPGSVLLGEAEMVIALSSRVPEASAAPGDDREPARRELEALTERISNELTTILVGARVMREPATAASGA